MADKDSAVRALENLLMCELQAADKIKMWNKIYEFTVERHILITSKMWREIIRDPAIGPTISDKRTARWA